MSNRAPKIQALLDTMVSELGIPQSVVSGSEHPYSCRCNTCKQWWLSCGPDPDGTIDTAFGPFGGELWDAYAAKIGMTVDQAQEAYMDDIEGGFYDD